MKIAVVTGASSGIGYEFVRQIAEGIKTVDEIWVIARREGRLLALRSEFGNKVRVFPMDLTAETELETFKKKLTEEKPRIKMLINSAGFGKVGSFDSISEKEQADMILLNCRALTMLTYSCLPFMEAGSRIIQMASAAAFVPQPSFAVYSASKSYVLSFSRALRRELNEEGIIVTAVCPGPVTTEFFQIAEQTGSTYSLKKLFHSSPERVVKKALMDSASKKELSIYSISMKLFFVLSKTVPHRWLLDIMDKIL